MSASVREVLDDRYRAREQGLTNSRAIIRRSANAIRSLHRGEIEAAAALINEAAALMEEAETAMADHPNVLHAGFLWDATKEYAEAKLTAALIEGSELPMPDEMGVDAVPYLKGLGEAVGELRRHMLDQLRAGHLPEAEATLRRMETVLDLLTELDYPDGMTSGLRRTTDVARALVERSRSDLTTSAVQERLRTELRESRVNDGE